MFLKAKFSHRKALVAHSFFGDLATGHLLGKFFSRNISQVILVLMTPVLSLCHVRGSSKTVVTHIQNNSILYPSDILFKAFH